MPSSCSVFPLTFTLSDNVESEPVDDGRSEMLDIAPVLMMNTSILKFRNTLRHGRDVLRCTRMAKFVTVIYNTVKYSVMTVINESDRPNVLW
jgi:hypothetical protein